MRTPYLQSPLARGVILTLAVTSLAGYVGRASCSGTTQPSAPATTPSTTSTQAAPPPAAPPAPANPPPSPPRFFAPATKSGFPIHGAPPQQPPPSQQQQ